MIGLSRQMYCFLIAGVVVGAYWHARHPETIERFSEAFDFGASASTKAPMASVFHINWSADGRRLLSFAKIAEAGDIRLTLHDATTDGAAEPIELPGSIVSAALVRDGREVVVGTCSGDLVRIDLESFAKTILQERIIQENAAPKLFHPAAVTDDGRVVAAADNEGLIRLYEPARRDAGALLTSSPGDQKSSVNTLRFSSDGTRLVSARNDGSIHIWDVVSGELVRVFHDNGKPVTAASPSPDGRWVVSAGGDDSIRIWDLASGEEKWRAPCGLLGVTAMALSCDGKTAACGGGTHKIIVWDLNHLYKKHEITTLAHTIRDLEFSPDGKRFAASGMDEAIRIYDTQTGAEIELIKIENCGRH
jgi:WD40 repeat protein